MWIGIHNRCFSRFSIVEVYEEENCQDIFDIEHPTIGVFVTLYCYIISCIQLFHSPKVKLDVNKYVKRYKGMIV